mmetsp:Transcript_23672/g.52196  ORF Transcript_23672/g.52196 Transcript_23672/m.52196 type:complete len:164 (-) Transcript_23672:7-498(-)
MWRVIQRQALTVRSQQRAEVELFARGAWSLHSVRGAKTRHPGDWENFASRGFIARDKPREAPYWPPPEAVEPIELPGGRKKVSVQAMKRDVDGWLEAQVVFTTAGGHRLYSLNEEELDELEKLAPRITEYLGLWQELAEQDRLSTADQQAATKLIEGSFDYNR